MIITQHPNLERGIKMDREHALQVFGVFKNDELREIKSFIDEILEFRKSKPKEVQEN